MDSRTIRQSLKIIFPSVVVGDKHASISIVAMRNGRDGPLSRALKDADKDAVRLVMENPPEKEVRCGLDSVVLIRWEALLRSIWRKWTKVGTVKIRSTG